MSLKDNLKALGFNFPGYTTKRKEDPLGSGKLKVRYKGKIYKRWKGGRVL